MLPKAKRRAISAIYAFAREVDDTADGDAPPDEKRRRLEELHRRLDVPPEATRCGSRSPTRASASRSRRQALHDFVDGGLMDLDRQRYDTFDELRGYCAHVAGAVGVACIGVYGADQPQRAETLGIALQLINIMRDVREDWELGRVYLPQDELAAHGVGEDDIRAMRLTPAWQSLMAYQAARARDYLEEGLTLLDYLDHRSSACVGTFAGLYRATLERIEERGFDVFDGKPQPLDGDEAPDRRREPAVTRPWLVFHSQTSPRDTACAWHQRCDESVTSSPQTKKVAVVGGGLAGLAAALELADRGHEVELHEARPTLGGAVQTLPEREGDPPPPPDNGQHIGLGCFTEWLRFLGRVGKAGAVRREPLRLPVIDERGKVATIGPGYDCSATRTCRSPRVSGSPVPRSRQRGQTPSAVADRTFADVLGAPHEEIDRFWDVFIRPALNIPTREAGADYGVFTVQTALLAGAARLRSRCSRSSRSARCTARRRAACSATGPPRLEAVESLDDLDADAVIVAVPPPEAARLLGQEPTGARGLADRQRPPALRPADPRAPPRCAAGLPRALGVRPRRPHRPRAARWRPVSDGGGERGPRSPRGARQGPCRDDGRLSPRAPRPRRASLVRVSREPRATFAARPGTRSLRWPMQTSRPDTYLAGAWVASDWPATMEAAVRSGVAAARGSA